ncbi:MAG: DUF389 domain-containing protein [Snowella sp.]|nr:DUF389 domain-containing protein [Snowella sp.]
MRRLRERFRIQITLEDFDNIYHSLIEDTLIDINYFVLILGSAMIATLGLLANSVAVIIGAMIIAPLMLPIRVFAFGAIAGNLSLLRKGLACLVVGTIFPLGLAFVIGYFAGIPAFESEVIARAKPTLFDLGIAITAGGISGFAKVQPKISASLAGTAIAVALMPPICVIGLGLSQANWSLSLGATLLYFTNLLGIILACMLTFLLTGYVPFYRAKKALFWAVIFTMIILIPLAISFIELVKQIQLETNLKKALLDRTITFHRVELLRTDTNWLMNPPEVLLTVNTRATVTPRQVSLLEDFIDQQMGRPFRLIFKVNQFEEVRAD